MRPITRSRPAATAHGALAVAILAAATGVSGGCQADRPAAPSARAGGSTDTAEEWDWGEDWASLPPAGSRARGARPAGSGAGSRGPSTSWAIVLLTFSAEGHQRAAANALQQLPAIAPQLGGGAWVRTTENGSIVVYGHYESPESAEAQRDLERVKTLTVRERQVFPRAILTRIRLPGAQRALHPHELYSARKRYPNVDPLYTLEVAVWGDFESGKLSRAEIHRRAEAYAQELRAQGFEAYFYHDDDKRLSVVTVGLFDRRAIDARSGLYSSQVDVLLERFPAHLVNGELLHEPISMRRPGRGTRVQKPLLVHVPK